MRPRASTSRLAVMLLLTLWAGRLALVIAHSQAHSHRYCLQHQAFEEESATAARGPSAGSADAAAPHAWESASAEEWLSPHEHCSLPAAEPREQAAMGSARLVRLAAWVGCAATAPACPLPSLSALDTAPKGSPPARA